MAAVALKVQLTKALRKTLLSLFFLNCRAQAYNKRISPKHVSVETTI